MIETIQDKRKMTNSDLQNIARKLKSEQHKTHKKQCDMSWMT